MMNKKDILDRFKLFFADTGGFDSWMTERAPDLLFDRLSKLDNLPLSFIIIDDIEKEIRFYE